MRILLPLGLLALPVGCGPAASSRKPIPRFVSMPSEDFSRDFARQTGFIPDSTRTPGRQFGYISEAALAKLPGGVRDRMMELDPVAFDTGKMQPATLARALSPFSGRTPLWQEAAVEPYHTHETLSDELRSLAASRSDLFALSSLGKTVQGRDIWMIKVSRSSQTAEVKPKALLVSTMHGNEIVGQEMLVYFLRLVASGHDTTPRLQELVNHGEIYVVPNLNPDGTAARMRFNADSVDLNRDFPDMLESGETPDTERAPETRAMMALINQNQFDSGLSFHGGAVCVNLPWDAIPNTPETNRFGDSALIESWAHAYAEVNGRIATNDGGNFQRGVTYGWEWYETHGNLPDWAAKFREAAMLTMEVSEIKWPDAAELPQFWEENREPILAYLESVFTGVSLKVENGSGAPVAATVGLDSSRRSLTFNDGVVFRSALPGARQLHIEAAGYAPMDLNVSAARFSGERLVVNMRPLEP